MACWLRAVHEAGERAPRGRRGGIDRKTDDPVMVLNLQTFLAISGPFATAGDADLP